MATSTADQKAAPGFAEFRFEDGALVQVSAYGGVVTVLQQQASTSGRGAAFLTPEQAIELADALHTASSVAQDQAKQTAEASQAAAAQAAHPPANTPVMPAAPVTPGATSSSQPAALSAHDFADILGKFGEKILAAVDDKLHAAGIGAGKAAG
jgi:hypothetical protein